MEKHLQQHLHRLRHCLHHHPTGHPALLVSRPDYTPVLKESGVLLLPASFICPHPNRLLHVFIVLSPFPLQDLTLHGGLPAGALSRLLRLLLLQLHDGGATAAAYLLGLPHSAHGPQIHNWKGECSGGPTTFNSRTSPSSLAYQQASC